MTSRAQLATVTAVAFLFAVGSAACSGSDGASDQHLATSGVDATPSIADGAPQACDAAPPGADAGTDCDEGSPTYPEHIACAFDVELNPQHKWPPPGCPAPGYSTHTLDFEDISLDRDPVLTGQYAPFATFSAPGDGARVVLSDQEIEDEEVQFFNTQPNILGGNGATVTIEFGAPVKRLWLLEVGSSSYGRVGLITAYSGDTVLGQVEVCGLDDVFDVSMADLTGFDGVTRIVIEDGSGMGWDDLTFDYPN